MHHEVRSRCPSLVNDDLVRKVNERVRDDTRIQKLVPRYDKCLNDGGECVEK